MGKKKILTLILIFLIVIIITYAFSSIKTEAPIIYSLPIIEETNTDIIKNGMVTVPQTEKILIDDTLKYKIIDRSIVAPIDKTNKKSIVLLTIDDGPSTRTKEILDILDKHNAKAIFFINGMHDKNNMDVIEETYKRGFAVGNHTWSHINLKKEKDTKIIEKEINKNTDLITSITGTHPLFFRAPYGESNPFIRDLIKKDGMIFMDWSGAAQDWNKSTIEKDIFVNNVMNTVHTGSIILIHEHPWSVANLDGLLTALEEKGYTYVDPKNIIE